jgi:EpsI family protein
MLTRASILFCCLMGGAVVIASANRTEQPITRLSFAQFPVQIEEWRVAPQPPIEPKILAVLGVDDYLTRAYYTPDQSAIVGLYLGYYASQRQGDTMHSPLNCLPGAGWAPLSNTRISIPVSRDSEIVVNRYIIQKGLDRQLVLYWYQSHGRAVASEYWSKLYLIRDAVRLNRTDGALVRVIAPIAIGSEDGGAAAERDAARFVRALYPTLPPYLPR